MSHLYFSAVATSPFRPNSVSKGRGGGGLFNQKKCHINSDKFKQSSFLIKLSYLHPVTYTHHRFRLIPVTTF